MRKEKENSIPFAMRMKPETRRRLEAFSKETGRSLSGLIETAIAHALTDLPDGFALYAVTGRIVDVKQTIEFAAFGKFFVRGEMSAKDDAFSSCYTYRVFLCADNAPATPETFPSLRAAFAWMREHA